MPKSIAEILLQTRENQGINKSEMARRLNVSSQQYGQYEGGKVEPKTDFRLKFKEVFGVDLIEVENNVSESGEEYKSEGDRMRHEKAVGGKKNKAIPVFNEVGAMAGNEFEMNMEPISEPTEYKSMSNLDLLEEADAVLRIWGSSMSPNYPSGTELALEVNFDKFFVPGEVYVIETRSNRVFKRIYNSSREGYIKCVSDNTIKHETGPLTGEYFYPPFEIPLSDIIKKFDILGLQKRNKNSKVYYRQTSH